MCTSVCHANSKGGTQQNKSKTTSPPPRKTRIITPLAGDRKKESSSDPVGTAAPVHVKWSWDREDAGGARGPRGARHRGSRGWAALLGGARRGINRNRTREEARPQSARSNHTKPVSRPCKSAKGPSFGMADVRSIFLRAC